LAKAAQDGKGCAEAFGLAAEAAERAVDETAPLQSQVSRASWLQERSKGLPDPGASLCANVFRSFWQPINWRRFQLRTLFGHGPGSVTAEFP
jgi:dihydroxyacetone kinase-like protein